MFRREHAINEEQMQNVWALYKQHPVVGICTRTIKGAVFGNGLKGLENYKPNLHRQLQNLANDALSWMFCIGLIPIVLSRDEISGEVSVHVPDHSSISMQVCTDALGKKSFTAAFKHESISVMRQMGGDTNARILVWSKCPNVPDSHGMLTTAITRLESSQRFSKFLHQRVMVAETLLSNPYHVTQAKAKANNDTDGVMWNVGDDVVQAAEQARIDTIENTQFHQYTSHTDKWGEVITGNDDETDALLQTGCRPREYYISAERELIRPQPATSAVTELHQISRAADESIYNIFGVPMSMFAMGSKATGATSNHLHEYLFNSTIMMYKNCIETLVNDIAALMGESFDMFEPMGASQGASANAVDGASVNQQMAYDFESGKQQLSGKRRLQLSTRPYMSTTDLAKLLQSGLLSQVDAEQMARSLLMLPDLETKPDTDLETHNNQPKFKKPRQEAPTTQNNN